MKRKPPSLTEFETQVLGALLAGDEYEMAILRSQLKSAVLAARLYDTPLWGILPRPSTHIQRRPGITLLVPSFGDYLGERRRIVFDDVVAELDPQRYLRLSAECEQGRLTCLRILGEATGPGEPLSPMKYRTDELSVRSVRYVEGPPTTLGQFIETRKQSYRRRLGAYPFIQPETPWQAYLAKLDKLHTPNTDAEGPDPVWNEVKSPPSGVSWAAPATTAEIDAFEREHGVILAEDTRELWRFTNGMAIQWWHWIWECRGTYDAEIWEVRDQRWLYMIDKAAGDSTWLGMTVREAEQPRELIASVAEFSFGDNRPDQTWDSFKDWIEERVPGRNV